MRRQQDGTFCFFCRLWETPKVFSIARRSWLSSPSDQTSLGAGGRSSVVPIDMRGIFHGCTFFLDPNAHVGPPASSGEPQSQNFADTSMSAFAADIAAHGGVVASGSHPPTCAACRCIVR